MLQEAARLGVGAALELQVDGATIAATSHEREATGTAMGMQEVDMEAGDALLFTDAITHGSARRVNEGERRILVNRYGPSWGNFRFGYQPSPELLARLTPRRRSSVWPQQRLERTPNRLAGNRAG